MGQSRSGALGASLILVILTSRGRDDCRFSSLFDAVDSSSMTTPGTRNERAGVVKALNPLGPVALR
jgi:hypothetical protein